ncbi:hypothetical protein MMC30_001189 [Trapelia coarctata]|nr:hypothetical protein [Trapelia coarctata]
MKPVLILTNLPIEILVQIFRYLLVLPGESHFLDPLARADCIQKPRVNNGPLCISGRLFLAAPPPNPKEIHTDILSVCKTFNPMAEHILYTQNTFVFQSAPALRTFIEKINQPTSMRLNPRSELVRTLKLHSITHDNDELKEWYRYLNDELAKDFSALKRLQVLFYCRSMIGIHWDGNAMRLQIVAPQILKTPKTLLWDSALAEVCDPALAADLLGEDVVIQEVEVESYMTH